MDQKAQQLMAEVIDLFAEEFKEQAILRGGMVLKVLGSSRYTNDLDYIFTPYRSKKEISEKILISLNKIPNCTTKYAFNSSCLRILLSVDQTKIQIEAKVAEQIKTSVISTQSYSPQFNLPKRLIRIVDHSISLSNKLAAWNERRLARDLFDIWFFMQMNIKPDEETLLKRLKKIEYSKLIKKTDYFKGRTLPEFYDFIRQVASDTPDSKIEAELSDYLTPEELAGITPLIKASLVKLQVQK